MEFVNGIENSLYMLNTSRDVLSLLESLLEHLEIVPDCFNQLEKINHVLFHII